MFSLFSSLVRIFLPQQKTNRNTHGLKQVHWVLKDGDHCFNTDCWISEHMLKCVRRLPIRGENENSVILLYWSYLGHCEPIKMVDAV